MQDYSDRVKIEYDEVSLPLVRRLAALLDLDPWAMGFGDELPLGWASLLFPSIARQSEIGADGHPRKGDFLPDLGFPRRRFAGRQVDLVQPLQIGARLSRRSTIADVVKKQGASGPMVFVTILHEIFSEDVLACVERQNVVYLALPTPGGAASKRTEPPTPDPDWCRDIEFDPVMLFRYSAVTYNSHRIHYDRDYATTVEGYPDLVVNGGLTTLLLLEMARSGLSRPITRYTMRALSILTVGSPVQLRGARTEHGAKLWAQDAFGNVAMRIDVEAG